MTSLMHEPTGRCSTCYQGVQAHTAVTVGDLRFCDTACVGKWTP